MIETVARCVDRCRSVERRLRGGQGRDGGRDLTSLIDTPDREKRDDILVSEDSGLGVGFPDTHAQTEWTDRWNGVRRETMWYRLRAILRP